MEGRSRSRRQRGSKRSGRRWKGVENGRRREGVSGGGAVEGEVRQSTMTRDAMARIGFLTKFNGGIILTARSL